jgi:hypothetical protein
MKKSLVIAAALAATAIAGNAMAINVNVVRTLRAQGLGAGNDSLGTVQLTALGATPTHCLYRMNWTSPFNPNDVNACIIREQRTAANPSCILNRNQDITSFVDAGPAAGTPCGGFDNLGVSFPFPGADGVTLMLGEFSLSPILQGVVIYPTALPTVLPLISQP